MNETAKCKIKSIFLHLSIDTFPLKMYFLTPFAYTFPLKKEICVLNLPFYFSFISNQIAKKGFFLLKNKLFGLTQF